jgi:integrase
VPLREKTLWTLAYESAARTSELLGLGDLDLANRRGVVTAKGGALVLEVSPASVKPP